MIVIRTALVAPPGRIDRPGGQSVKDLILLCAKESDGIEHVRVSPAPLGFYVVWFMLADGDRQALNAAISVSHRVIAAMPSLTGWAVAA